MTAQPDGWLPDASGEHLGSLDDAGPELCDECGAVIYDGSELYAMMLDSSSVDPVRPGLDGRRRLVACGGEHLDALRRYYLGRPFDHDELRAHVVNRAQQDAERHLTLEELTRATGMTLGELLGALAWRSLWFDWLPDGGDQPT